MTLTILGCGTVSWQAGRACSSYHMRAGGAHLLMDCGSGAMKRFEDAGIDYFDLDALLLSHTQHPDHAMDFGMLLFSLNYSTQGNELRVREKPLRVYGPSGTRACYEHLAEIHPPIVPTHYELEIIECADDDAELKGVRLASRTVSHGDTPAVGYRLEASGKVLAYSGDTGPCDALVALAHEADLAIMECSVEAEVVDLPAHLDARQVGLHAQRSDVRRLLVTHQYPGWRPEVVERQIREHYDGPIHFARDLDGYEL